MTTALILRELAERLAIAANNIEPARQRLAEQQPGFPSTASGANPGSSPPPEHVDDDRGKSTIVERTANQRDAARTALDDVNRISRDLAKRFDDVTKLYNITLTWAPPATTPQRVTEDDDHQWCTNHLSIGTCEPRTRGTLCRWCDDFLRSQGWQPTRALMRERAAGGRITERMIADAKPPPVTTPKAGKRRKGKR
jgi:hypothetical protein